MEKTKNPPAIATVGAVLLVIGLWASMSGESLIGVGAIVLAVLCGILWATAAYVRRD